MVTRTNPLDELTPRQREVLKLVARGMTNGAIAKELGITLDGAKWHVREIITRLGVESREEAAAIWRQELSALTRSRRWLAGLALKPVAALATGSLVVAGVVVVVVAIATQTGGDTPPAGQETPPAALSPTAAITTPDPATSNAPPTPAPSHNADLGIFTEPRLRDADEPRPLGERPDSPFPDHDGETLVLYDFATGQLRDFGPGGGAQFTPDDRWMFWATNEFRLFAVELPDGEPLDLGTDWNVQGYEDDHLLVVSQETDTVLRINLHTAERVDTGDPPPLFGLDFSVQRGPLHLVETIFEKQPMGGRRWEVRNQIGGVLIVFDGLQASWASDHQILLAVTDYDGYVNLFLLDVYQSRAEFVATAPQRGFSAAANEQWIAWSEDYCGEPPDWQQGGGPSRVLDRRTGTIYSVGANHWIVEFAPDGRLAVDGWGLGAHAVLDLDAWTYDAVLPDGTPRVQWSSDYRYATRGGGNGHGSQCM